MTCNGASTALQCWLELRAQPGLSTGTCPDLRAEDAEAAAARGALEARQAFRASQPCQRAAVPLRSCCRLSE